MPSLRINFKQVINGQLKTPYFLVHWLYNLRLLSTKIKKKIPINALIFLSYFNKFLQFSLIKHLSLPRPEKVP